MDEEYVMVNGRKMMPRKMMMGNKVYYGVQLNLHFSMGIKQRVPCFVFSEESCVYVNGHHIILYDIAKKTQSFLLRQKDEEDVVVMNYCLNDKQVLSVGVGLRNTIKNYATVRVYKSNKKQFTLQHQHLAFGVQIKDLRFINHSKFTITLCNSIQNSHYISIFKTSAQKLITYVDQREIYSGLFGSFLESTIVGTYGPGSLKIWAYNAEEKTMDDTDMEILGNPIQVVQVKKNYFVLSAEGLLQFYKKTKFTDKYDIVKEIGQIPCAMADHSTGVVVGFEVVPILVIFETQKGRIIHRKQYTLNIPNFQKIQFLHAGPEDSYFSIVAQHKIRMSENESPESNCEIYLFNYGIVDIISTALRDPFEALFPQGVHKSRLIQIDTSPCKPIVSFLSEERILKVWEFNYSRGEFKCLYSIQLHEIPLCMSLHPLSFQCAIGYREGLKFYFVLHDDVKQVYYENLKQCTALKYTAGGNQLAVGTQNQILLYDPYTYTVLHTISGHSGTIQTLEWSDSLLISTCSQGLVMCFNQTRIVDHSFKAHKGFCQTYDQEFDLLIGCYIDQKVRLFNEKGLNLFYEMDVYPCSYVSVVIFKQLEIIVFGTQCGKIRIYLWPFTQFKDDQEYYELQLHQGPLTQIKLTADLSFLITGSDDGSVQICSVREFYEGKDVTATSVAGKEMEKQSFSLSNLYNFNMLAFVSKNSQEIKREQNKELDFRIQNLKSDIDDQKQEISQKYTQNQKELELNNQQTIADQKEYLSQIMENSDIRLKQLDYDLEQLRIVHRKESQKIKDQTEENLLELYKKNDELRMRRQTYQELNLRELEKTNRDFDNLKQSLHKDYEQKYNDLVQRFSNSNDSIKLDELKFKEVFQETEKEYEILINQEKSKKMVILDEIMKKSEETRSKNTKYKKEIEQYKMRKQELEILIRDTTVQVNHLSKDHEGFLLANKEVQNRLKEREKLIFQKEKEIKNFRNKNGHLQNFKNVNSYRLSSLQEQKVPLAEHLVDLDVNTKVMYQELTDEAEAEKNLNKHIEDTQEHIQNSKIKLNYQNDSLFQGCSKLQEIENQILTILASPEISDFRQHLKQVHREYFQNAGPVNEDLLYQEMENNTQQAIREEMMRQRDFLSKKINTVMRTSKASDEDKTSLIIKVQNENTQLIKSCNELREQRASLKQHLSNMQKALDLMSKEISNLNENDEQIELNEEDSQIEELQFQEQPKISKKISAPKLTPFQQYHHEQDIARLRRSENVIRRPLPNTTLNNLLKEIKSFNDSDLREQVQQFLRNDESSSILPQIMKQNQNQSQEDTAGLESSIINTSIDTRIVLPSIIKKQ